MNPSPSQKKQSGGKKRMTEDLCETGIKGESRRSTMWSHKHLETAMVMVLPPTFYSKCLMSLFFFSGRVVARNPCLIL